MTGSVAGGRSITGGKNSYNEIYGDARYLGDYSQVYGGTLPHGSAGGNDTLVGGAHSVNVIYGDAYGMEASTGGNDTIIGGTNNFTLIYSGAVYSGNFLYGDAYTMYASTGGNDTLISSTGVDYMWGDAVTMDPNSTGGADTFVFFTNNNRDIIYDFRHSDGDKIDVSAILDFGTLDSNHSGTLDEGDAAVTIAAGNTVIDLGAAIGRHEGMDTVTLLGVTHLNASDFFSV